MNAAQTEVQPRCDAHNLIRCPLCEPSKTPVTKGEIKRAIEKLLADETPVTDEELKHIAQETGASIYSIRPIAHRMVIDATPSVQRRRAQRENERRAAELAKGVKPIKSDAEAHSFFNDGPPVATWPDYFKGVQELEQGEVRMLIDGFLPEGVTFIGGLPGEGKTLLGLSIARALTTGNGFLGRFAVPKITPVIYLIPESGGRAFRKRCEKFGIPNNRELFICRTISEGPTLGLDSPLLLEAVQRLKPVVILDTLIRFSDAQDENSSAQNRQLVNGITALRIAGAAAVVAMHHATKAMRTSGMTLETVLRGTGDIAAYADAVYGLLRDNNLYDHGNGPNELDIECVKPRDFDPPLPFRVAASRKTGNHVIGLAAGIESVIDRFGDFAIVEKSAVQRSKDVVLIQLIREDPAISLKELSEAVSMSTWEIRKRLKMAGWFKTRGHGSHLWTDKNPEAKSIV